MSNLSNHKGLGRASRMNCVRISSAVCCSGIAILSITSAWHSPDEWSRWTGPPGNAVGLKLLDKHPPPLHHVAYNEAVKAPPSKPVSPPLPPSEEVGKGTNSGEAGPGVSKPLAAWEPKLCDKPCQATPPLSAWRPPKNAAVRHDLRVLWPGNGTKAVMVNEVVTVTIEISPPLNWADAPFVFAYIHSTGRDILAAEAASPQKAASPQLKMSQIAAWQVSFRLMDPGMYKVDFLALTPPHADAKNPRAYRLDRMRDGSQQLQASHVNSDGTKTSSFSTSLLPQRRCQLGRDELRGRWVRSSLVGEAMRCDRLGCPRDGWTYVSRTCYWHVYSPADVHRLVELIDSDKHLSLVAAGSSVLRGCVQSLMDHLVPRAWESFTGVVNIPGYGTTTKCWGWMEYEVDRLNLAFHDWRLPSYEWRDRPAAAARIQRTISEGHDLVVIELGFNVHSDQIGFDSELRSFWEPIFRAVLPSLSGKIILWAGLYSPFNFQVCTLKHCAISWDRVRWLQQSVDRLIHSWPKGLQEASTGKILVMDPAPMALAMFFDGETETHANGNASQHWHRYDNSQKPGRKVFGAVADVVGQLFISQLLSNRKFIRTPSSTETQTTRACAQCPEKSCCPWRPIPLELNYTLAKIRHPPSFSSWAQLPLAGCGRIDVKKGNTAQQPQIT